MSTTPATRFSWAGKNLSGHAVRGETEAADVTSLRRLLYAQGIVLSNTKKIRSGAVRTTRPHYNAAEITVFLRQCASLLTAGLPLTQALEICTDSTPGASFKQELQSVRDQIASGASFTSALRAGSLGRDRLLLNLIQAAEQSGTLDTMMEKLAHDSEKAAQLRARVKKALTYPMAVLVVAVVITLVLLIKVVPQFAQTFSDLGAELPALTRSVLRLSELAMQYSFVMAILCFLSVLTVTVCLRRYPRARCWRDQLFCHLPVIGEIVRHACLARFCQILSSSIKAGVPLLQALQSSAPATGNLVYEHACLDLAEQINQGQTLSFGVRKARCFPVMMAQLIHAGEQSGTLDQMLENCGRRYEQSVDNAVDKLSSLIEPVIMTLLGTVVAILLLAMYLPVFRLGAVL